MADPSKQDFLQHFSPHAGVKSKTIGIVYAEWNQDVTGKLLEGAQKALIDAGIPEDQIVVKAVPGSFELPLGARYLIEYANTAGVICLGCVIQGETPHFTFISDAVAQKLADLNLEHNLPVIFGVLTTNNQEQAMQRAGGNMGNKGEEAAVSLLKMLSLKEELRK